MSVLHGQAFRRDFVEIVASIIYRVCAKQTAPAPKVYGGQDDAVAGGHILRRQKPLGEQTRTPIGKTINRPQSADTRARPRSCHHSAHTPLIEYICDFPSV